MPERESSSNGVGGFRLVTLLDELPGVSLPGSLLNLDEALRRLEQLEPRAAQVVEMRFFAGMTEEEIAEALGISPSSVKREWTFARAWLRSQLHGSAE